MFVGSYFQRDQNFTRRCFNAMKYFSIFEEVFLDFFKRGEAVARRCFQRGGTFTVVRFNTMERSWLSFLAL